MTDFYLKPYNDQLYSREEEDDPVLPLFFFDNDDGFWSKYIQQKHAKWEAHDMITNRPFIKV